MNLAKRPVLFSLCVLGATLALSALCPPAQAGMKGSTGAPAPVARPAAATPAAPTPAPALALPISGVGGTLTNLATAQALVAPIANLEQLQTLLNRAPKDPAGRIQRALTHVDAALEELRAAKLGH